MPQAHELLEKEKVQIFIEDWIGDSGLSRKIHIQREAGSKCCQIKFQSNYRYNFMPYPQL